MGPLIRLGLALCLAFACMPALSAQPRTPKRPETASAAMKAFERDRAEPEDRRVRSVRNLGGFDDETVVVALVTTWQEAKTVDLRLAALQALAERRRDGRLEVFVEAFATDADLRIRDAAATGLGRLGDPGVAVLREKLKELDGRKSESGTRTLRLSLLTGLGIARTESAANALAQIAADDKDPERLDALRQLASGPDTPAVTKARESALAAATAPLVTVEALRQLATQHWPGTKKAALDLSRRLPAKTVPAVHAGLVDVLGTVLDAETAEPFLLHAGTVEGDLDERHKEAMTAARGSPTFLAWVTTQGIALKNATARLAAVHVLAPVKDEVAARALAALARGDDAEIAHAAIRAFAVRGDAALVPVLRELATTGPEARRGEALVALHALAPKAPETRKLLESQLAAPFPAVRTITLDLLAEPGSEDLLPQVWKLFDDKTWTVRAAAYAFCRKVRGPGSVPALIARLDKEKARMHEDVLDALEALTVMRFGDTQRWLKWWDENAKTFALPPVKERDNKPTPKGGGGATVSSYYDIPFTSQSVAFLVDTSGSMAARIGTGGQSRLDESKRQLERIVTAMAESVRFNLITFESVVHELDRKVGLADKKRKEQALAYVAKLAPRGGTNIFDALEKAFADPEIDTIYLLSDGDPSAGRIQDPDAILAEVQRWNRTRRLRIHTISVGADSKFLKRLAELAGGEYRYVR